ncbi:Threonine dehydratase [Klebsiella pneumoniae IS46]|nr:Threonine dehydratase [Klebsiella pneumoniae IS46]
MDTIKFQLNARRQPYGQGADLSLLNESVGNEVLAFHQKILLITGSRRCVSWNF